MNESAQPLSPPSRPKLWMAAIKPPMYSVAVIPIAVGTAIAFYESHRIDWWTFGGFILSAVFILLWENLCNDVFDADTGIDRHKLHSIVNLTGKKYLVLAIAYFSLCLGLVGVVAISWHQQDGMVLGLIALCCLLGYSYQGPPLRLGYLGLGEPICFVCFGPLAVAAAYYSQTQTWSPIMLLASIPVGAATTLILFCSHFNQVTDDLAAGKRSPVARLGSLRSAQLLPWACAGIYVPVLWGVAIGIFPVATAATLCGLPIAWHLCDFIAKHHDRENLLTSCRFIAVKLHFCTGVCLGLGFALPVITW